jgi:hypothetical protein
VRLEAPDFERLPVGTKEQFERRLERLPLHRVRIRIDFDAVLRNESRFNDRFCAEHGLSDDDNCALATWHLNAVHQRLHAARPDLKPHRQHRLPRGHFLGPERQSIGPDGKTTTSATIYRRHPGTKLDRLAWTLRRLTPNFMVGWPCWFGNRWSGVRGVWVGHRAAQFGRSEGT